MWERLAEFVYKVVHDRLFEVDARNIFDIKFRTTSSFSQFLISEERTYIQPRTIVFKVSYKL